ncbi:hypothetical protein D3C86_1732850 [compost metagenome]
MVGLLEQLLALLHTEAMLLINDNKAQLMEMYRLLNKRMSAYDNIDRPVRNLFVKRLTSRTFDAPG